MMRIAVVDLTAPGTVEREKLHRVVRAINRQIEQDFFPYWNLRGELRVEALAKGALPGPGAPPGGRSDGVLYLVEGVGDGSLLGVHELHEAGVAFGYVHLDVSKRLGEPWSVTLSHEALEMLADSNVNLLCQGPHPDRAEGGRLVYHWVEVCDAVQAESYEIDGEAVSNFVLPAYYTPGGSRGGRNDFLGRPHASGRALLSFDVSPGGYVGFFDPQLGRDDQFSVPGDRASEARQATKREALGQLRVRRSDRRDDAGQKAQSAPGASVSSIVFHLKPGEGSGHPDARAATAVIRCLGPGWGVRRAGWEKKGAPPRYQALPPASQAPGLSGVGEGFDAARSLGADPFVERAEPALVHVLTPTLRRARGSSSGEAHLPGTEVFTWSLRAIGAPDDWGSGAGARPGAGVLVGHPDTGYSDHPEIFGKIDATKGRDFLHDDGDARDEFERDALLPFPGHGTATASVLVSDPGPQSHLYAGGVTGVAPGARLVPLRISRSVVQISQENLAQAIHRAVDVGCRVISMSVGGLPSGELHRAVRRAVDEGVIVCAAAGNYVGFVAWPAAYPEVISVAACNINDEPWWGTSSGSAVTISAPGESVWHASFFKNATGPGVATVERGAGTSFAVAAVAGAAAVWLAHHGLANLLDTYAPRDLVRAFRHALVTSCRTPVGWPVRRMGAGILDLPGLLGAPLPAVAALAVEPPVEPLAQAVGEIEALLGPGAPADLAGELLAHLTTSPFLHEELGRARQAAAAGARGAGVDLLVSSRRALERVASRGLLRALRPQK